MATHLRKGQRVSWNTPQGRTQGTVERRVTETTTIKGHTVKASADNPEYVVRSERSGARAAHKPASLRRERSK
jgi:Hypervirulence associated proteins TUDOR domain